MKHMLRTLIGEEAKLPFEHRVFNIILIIAVLVCSLSSIINYISGLNMLVTLVAMIALVYLFWESAIKRNYNIAINLGLPLYLFVFLPLFWVFGAGTFGGFPYIAIVTTSAIVFLTSGLKRMIYFICLILVVITLLVLEFKLPNLIMGYVSHTDRLVDVAFSIIISIIANIGLIVLMLNSYRKEHKRSREYLAYIEKQNAELKKANQQLQLEIFEREQVENRLEYLATHDYLTGVPNRLTFEKTLSYAVTKAPGGNTSALVLIDVDNFKLINDTKGHTAGDYLLISIARIIQQMLDKSDTLARLGG